jgi:hypothetical protein
MVDSGRPVPRHGSGPASYQPEHPEDVCECGDYRRQHDDHGCILCRNFPAPTGRCLRFRLFRPAAAGIKAEG